jgi:thiol:disulfide interchange protein DsbD
MAVNFIIGGVFLGFINKTPGATKVFTYIKYLVGILFILVGLNYGLEARQEYRFDKGEGEETEIASWRQYSESALSVARENGTPVLIDFYADWCEPCKELDRITFRNAEFISAANNFVLIKADLTNNKDAKVEALRKKYDVKGVPTLVFIDREGNIAKSMVGFQDAATLVRIMRKLEEKMNE